MQKYIPDFATFEEFINDALARVHAANERFEMLGDRIQPVLDHGDLIRRYGANRIAGETEIRDFYREPNPRFVDYDWSTPVGLQTKEVSKPGPITRKPIPHKRRDYHCGIPAMFCDDLKETIHSIVGHDVNLSFLDVDETDDLFNRVL